MVQRTCDFHARASYVMATNQDFKSVAITKNAEEKSLRLSGMSVEKPNLIFVHHI